MSPFPHDTLAEALVAVQAAAPKLRTNDTAKVQTKGGGEYSYKYLTLDKLMEQVLPVLADHGLAWVTQPSGSTAEPTLAYALIHAATADRLAGEMPLYLGGVPTAQAHGSAITYARRYALMAVLGLCAEDDDGRKASEAPRRQQTANGNGAAAKMSAGALKAFTDELADLPDAGLILAAAGVSTKNTEWLATDGPKIREAIDSRNRTDVPWEEPA